jgi:hypothetical protein
MITMQYLSLIPKIVVILYKLKVDNFSWKYDGRMKVEVFVHLFQMKMKDIKNG